MLLLQSQLHSRLRSSFSKASDPLVLSVLQDVIQVSKKYLPGMAVGYSSAKLTLHVGDGFEFMKQNQEAFDVIITDSSDPMGKSSGHKRALLSIYFHIPPSFFFFCLPLGSYASLPRILSSEKTVANLALLVGKGKDGNHETVLTGLQASCYISLLKIQLQQLFLLAELFPECSNPMGDAAPLLARAAWHTCLLIEQWLTHCLCSPCPEDGCGEAAVFLKGETEVERD